MFNWAGQITGEHFAGIVKNGESHDTFRIYVPIEFIAGNNGQSMSQYSRLQTVLLNILALGVAHYPPALNELHARQIGKKVTGTVHYVVPSFPALAGTGYIAETVRLYILLESYPFLRRRLMPVTYA